MSLTTLLSLLLLPAAMPQDSKPAESRGTDGAKMSTFDNPQTPEAGGARAEPKAGQEVRPANAGAALSKPTEVEVAVVKRDGVKVRCYPAETGLAFDKLLAKDEKVLVRGIDFSGRYHDVEVLTGLPGFVAAKYVQLVEPGKGKTTGANVSLRVRPRGSEPPAATLTQGIELRLLQKEGDWWRVQAPVAVQAFVEATELSLAGKPAEHEKDLAALRGQGEKTWTDAVAVEKGRLARDEKGQVAAQKIQECAARFEHEKTRPVAEQDLGGVVVSLQAVLDDAAKEGIADSPTIASGRTLLEEVRRRRVIQDAYAAARAVPPKANIPLTPPPLKIAERDPLSRFDGIGHLVYRPTPEGAAEYQLVKGGQLLFYVTCSSGKYELQTFNNRELGMRGSANRPEGARVRVLDVSHIEVIGNR
jgi:hypothetical protein